MTRFNITLLGRPQIKLDGVPVKVPTLRAIPMLAYLAVTGTSQTRETLANLLWSESSSTHALGSLRTTLWRLNSSGLGEWIVLDHNEISLNYQKTIDVDVLEFKEKINQSTTHGHSSSQICLLCIPILTEAVELYHGEFLYGINLSKAQPFDEWRLQEGETLQILYLDALERLVRGHRTFGNFTLAIEFARRRLKYDKYNESAQYDLLQLYFLTGQRTAAINHYKQYINLVSRELGIEPSDDFTRLYKQILGGRTPPAASKKLNAPILLTADVENASLYWTHTGKEKATILSKYHDIFKETCKLFGGQILQKSDDNITVLFDNGQPLHCAVTIHLKMKKMDWGIAGIPKIRMVVYSTTTDSDQKKSFSMITRTASNLLSIGWGGQVLLTEQTLRDLDLPAGSQVKDLGHHSFTDSRESIHVYELHHPHLPPIEHLPLQSLVPQSVNFPVLSPAFIGRDDELEQLSKLLDAPDNRIVSLVGPGGVGKTSLVVQFANQVASHFSDGTFFVSLAHVQDPDLIPINLAEILKFSFLGPSNYYEQLGNYLKHKNILLIFDNFEHLQLGGTKFLASLLNQTQYLKILVTTRERLNLISETIMEIQGLPVPALERIENSESYSSVRLFLNTAQRISPTFKYENNAAAIIRICRLVNGLPLGIILAASCVRAYNCEKIEEEIHNNIDFLATTAPDLSLRHSSLRAVFDNSWRLLSEDERIILARLSIFQVPFTAHAAMEICMASPRSIAAYVDKSLLQRQGEIRYEMLNTFQQYASEKLEALDDELTITRTKFCDYYVDFCTEKHQELNSAIQKQGIEALTSEIENIQTAWDWMIDSNRWDMISKVKEPLLAYYVILGNFVQGRELFRLALQKLDSLKTPSMDLTRASMQQLEAWLTFRIGFTAEGLAGLNKSIETFHQYNSQWDVAMTSLFLAEAYRTLGNPGQAEINIRDALRILHQDSMTKSNYIVAFTAHCQSVLGTILMENSDLEAARMNIEASLATHNQLGTYYGTIHPTMGLAKLAYLQGDYAQARDLYLQALDTAIFMGDQRDEATIHNNLSDIYQEMASPSDSYQHLHSALQLCNETGDHRLKAIILNNLAYHQLRYLQHPSEAIRTYHESIEIFSTIGDLRGIVYSYYDISKAYLEVGLLKEAANFCSRSLQTALTLDSIPLTLHALHGYANLFINTDELERALRLCHLIEHHPQVEPDTQKRAIATRVEIETRLPAETIDAAHGWADSANLQDVIDQVLSG
jgi:predicted ATPase/DNA-binding SARP family transcriptional activator